MAYSITTSDREWFKRCRRAWDFGSSARQNYEPIVPHQIGDFAAAIRDALAVYYYPGMWGWPRAVIAPMALQKFTESLHQQYLPFIEGEPLSPEAEQQWNRQLACGQELLTRYFEWAPTVDGFHPMRVDTDFEVMIPDPWHPDQGLLTPDGEPLLYRGNVALVVVDNDGAYWIIDHKVTEGTWTDRDDLILDDRCGSYCWAVQEAGRVIIAGVIHNEWRIDGPTFRRTSIPKSQAEITQLARQAALEALDMMNPTVRIYPHPTTTNCVNCAYRSPCLALTCGLEAGLILGTLYRKRSEGEARYNERRIGQWSHW